MLANINSLELVACETHSGHGFLARENSLSDGFSDVDPRASQSLIVLKGVPWDTVAFERKHVEICRDPV